MADEINPIPRVTRDDPAAHSGDVVAENIAALKALFPVIVTDGKVDFDVLRQVLGDAMEDSAERYGLNWKGKARARAFALTPSLGTLRPAKADSKAWDTTKNILIEGDNLEVLKLLRKSYAGKVKLIYIDPPYNTGKDFVYPDNYSDSLDNYEALTGQRGADGARLTSNKESSGRFHTDWLNMMYPRLILAKEFLREDGLIFVSCNDSEQSNLQIILDDVFGSDNHISDIIWKKSYGGGSKVKHVITHHEYVLCYSKNKASIPQIDLPPDPNAIKYYKFKDNKFPVRGPYRLQPLATTSNDERENLRYAIPYNGEEIWPEKQWQWERSRTLAALEDDNLVIENRSGRWSVSYKQYLRNADGVERGAKPTSIMDGPYTQTGTSEVVELMGDPKLFSFPKPVGVPSAFLGFAHPENDFIAMDFFAGSGTTGHAVMAQNAADGGSRRYILVQLPEPLNPAKAEQKTAADFCDELGKPRTISELTKERLRRAGEKVKADNLAFDIDTGFRVYKLATSNLKPWQPGDDLAADLLDATSNVLAGRSDDDLLVELLLKTGIDLALPCDIRTIAGCNVHSLGGGTLMVTLADLPAAQAQALGDGIADWLDELEPPAPTTFFFKDSGFDAGGSRAAEARANLAATLRQRRGEDAIEKLGAI